MVAPAACCRCASAAAAATMSTACSSAAMSVVAAAAALWTAARAAASASAAAHAAVVAATGFRRDGLVSLVCGNGGVRLPVRVGGGDRLAVGPNRGDRLGGSEADGVSGGAAADSCCGGSHVGHHAVAVPAATTTAALIRTAWRGVPALAYRRRDADASACTSAASATVRWRSCMAARNAASAPSAHAGAEDCAYYKDYALAAALAAATPPASVSAAAVQLD